MPLRLVVPVPFNTGWEQEYFRLGVHFQIWVLVLIRLLPEMPMDVQEQPTSLYLIQIPVPVS